MAIEVDGIVYYRTSEACAKAGVSRATLFRWLRTGILEQRRRDRRGWRVFTEDDINRIRTEAKRIVVECPGPAVSPMTTDGASSENMTLAMRRQPDHVAGNMTE